MKRGENTRERERGGQRGRGGERKRQRANESVDGQILAVNYLTWLRSHQVESTRHFLVSGQCRRVNDRI